MSHSLNWLKRVINGTTIGVIKRDILEVYRL